MAAFLDIYDGGAAPPAGDAVAEGVWETYDEARRALEASSGAVDEALAVENYWRYTAYRGCHTAPSFEEMRRQSGAFLPLRQHPLSAHTERPTVRFRCIYKLQSGYDRCPGGFKFALATQTVQAVLVPPPHEVVHQCSAPRPPPPATTPAPLPYPPGYDGAVDAANASRAMWNDPHRVMKAAYSEADAYSRHGLEIRLRCGCPLGAALPALPVESHGPFARQQWDVALKCATPTPTSDAPTGVGEVAMTLTPSAARCACHTAAPAARCHGGTHDAVPSAFLLELALEGDAVWNGAVGHGSHEGWNGTVRRFALVEPAPGVATLEVQHPLVEGVAVAEVATDQEFMVELRTCGETFRAHAGPNVDVRQALTVSVAHGGPVALTALHAEVRGVDTLRLTYGPLLDTALADALHDPVAVSFAMAPALRGAFVSGILPQLAAGNATVIAAGRAVVPPDAACRADADDVFDQCHRRGRCRWFRCECSVGWEGRRCEIAVGTPPLEPPAPKSTLPPTLAVAGVGAVLAPMATVSALQMAYFVSGMPCAGDAAQHTAGLKLFVSPLVIGSADDPAERALWGTLLLHAVLAGAHGLAVMVGWARASAANRPWGRILAKHLAPNVSIVLAQFFTPPLFMGMLEVGVSSAGVIGVIWGVMWIAGYALLLLWLGARRLAAGMSHVEYVEVAGEDEAGGCLRLLRRALPGGYWSSQHLHDRGFLRKFGLVVWGYGPHGARWSTLLTYLHLLAVVGLAKPSQGGCRGRLVAMSAATGLHFLRLLWKRPHDTAVGNALACLSAASLQWVLAAALLAWDSRPPLTVLGVCLIAAQLWGAFCTAYAVRAARRRGGDEDAVGDVCLPTRVQGWAAVAVREGVTSRDLGEGDPRAPSPPLGSPREGSQGSLDNLVPALEGGAARYWCEVRGATVFCFEVRRSAPRPALALALTELVPLGEDADGRFVLVNEEKSLTYEILPDTARDEWALHLTSEGLSRTHSLRLTLPVASCDQYAFPPLPLTITSTGVYRRCTDDASGSPDPLVMHVVEKADLSLGQQAALASELAVLTRLRCRFLVDVTDAFETDDALCWVMPWVPGGGLHAYVGAAGALAEGDAAFYIAEALLGLEHLHANRLVFRNLSPEDVMFDHDGHLLLADPGIPVPLLSDTKIPYAAPEVLRHEGATPKSDLWSLGCIAYYMVHARAPFQASSRAAKTRLILGPPPRLHTAVSKAGRSAIYALISHCVDLRPSASDARDLTWFAAQGIHWGKLERRLPQSPLARSAQARRASSVATGGAQAPTIDASEPEPANPLMTAFARPPCRASPPVTDGSTNVATTSSSV
eukprot:TRINITY_DN18335_c0_g2_i1.p1 TRINITY_DN18335_c0_g2~~TRINITY_DN18335_c0_g2_i1.p1  ORF type:complete len:1392 (+),score=337.75 TRINITY_DN18335_c0_g2_i1:207-4178(+)